LHADIDSAAKGYDSGSSGSPPSSSYCREYNSSDLGSQHPPGNNEAVWTSVSSSVEGGAYSGSTGDNAISVRAWVRTGTTNPIINIYCKNTTNDGTESNTNAYRIRYNNATLVLYAKGADYATITGITTDEWHRIRLDYIPVASMKDVISLYTSSAGGTNTETWELVHTEQILSTDPNYITASTPTNIGYSVQGYTDDRLIWIDDFDVYVTPAG